MRVHPAAEARAVHGSESVSQGNLPDERSSARGLGPSRNFHQRSAVRTKPFKLDLALLGGSHARVHRGPGGPGWETALPRIYNKGPAPAGQGAWLAGVEDLNGPPGRRGG